MIGGLWSLGRRAAPILAPAANPARLGWIPFREGPLLIGGAYALGAIMGAGHAVSALSLPEPESMMSIPYPDTLPPTGNNRNNLGADGDLVFSLHNNYGTGRHM